MRRKLLSVQFVKHWPTAGPCILQAYVRFVGSVLTVRLKPWCCWGLSSRTSSLPKQGKQGWKPSICVSFVVGLFARDPRHAQTVRSSGPCVLLLKVLWPNKIGKSDLRWTCERSFTFTQTELRVVAGFSNATTIKRAKSRLRNVIKKATMWI